MAIMMFTTYIQHVHQLIATFFLIVNNVSIINNRYNMYYLHLYHLQSLMLQNHNISPSEV